MNPFDLRGPQFLLFYLGLSLVVLAAVFLRRRPASDPEGIPSRIDDAFQLAALRAGPVEAIRVGLLSLLDRRLLKAKDGTIEVVPGAGADHARRPLEKGLLRAFAGKAAASAAFEDAAVKEAADAVEAGLTRAGLLADERSRGKPTGLAYLGAGVLVVVAGIKIAIALSRGRTNVGLLLGMTAVAAFLALVVGARPRRTRRGEKALELARRSFARLKHAASPGGETNELALAAAVFGVAALPPLAREMMIEARVMKTSSSGGSSCGSSCGSSSCGGGCGGGCGGCGG